MKKNTNVQMIKRMTFIASFSAITCILYIFAKFNLPIFPSFLDINLSMIPVIIAAFMLGPWDAAVIVIIRCLVKLPMSKTGYVGEFADVLMGLAAALPAGFIYHKCDFKNKTLVAFSSVVIGWVLMGILSNILINIPWYSKFYFNQNYYKDGVPAPLLGMCKDAFNLITFKHGPTLTNNNFMFYYIVLAVIPFNLLLSIVVVGITIPVHKRLKVLYDMIGANNNSSEIVE